MDEVWRKRIDNAYDYGVEALTFVSRRAGYLSLFAPSQLGSGMIEPRPEIPLRAYTSHSSGISSNGYISVVKSLNALVTAKNALYRLGVHSHALNDLTADFENMRTKGLSSFGPYVNIFSYRGDSFLNGDLDVWKDVYSRMTRYLGAVSARKIIALSDLEDQAICVAFLDEHLLLGKPLLRGD